MKTIKQIADGLGVDKQRVYRYIRKHCISEAHQKHGVMHYDDAVETMIIRHFMDSGHINDVHQKPHHDVHHTASLDAVISMLKTELDVKNKLIDEQQQTINKLTDTLAAAQRTTQTEQLLHADTKGIPLLSGTEPAQPDAPTVGLWGRLFKRKKGNR